MAFINLKNLKNETLKKSPAQNAFHDQRVFDPTEKVFTNEILREILRSPIIRN